MSCSTRTLSLTRSARRHIHSKRNRQRCFEYISVILPFLWALVCILLFGVSRIVVADRMHRYLENSAKIYRRPAFLFNSPPIARSIGVGMKVKGAPYLLWPSCHLINEKIQIQPSPSRCGAESLSQSFHHPSRASMILYAKSKVKAKGGLADSRAAALAALEELEREENEMDFEPNEMESDAESVSNGKVLDKKALKAQKKREKEAKKQAKKAEKDLKEKAKEDEIISTVSGFNTEQDWEGIDKGVDPEEKLRNEMLEKSYAPQTGDGGAGGLSKKQQKMTGRMNLDTEKDLFVVKNEEIQKEDDKTTSNTKSRKSDKEEKPNEIKSTNLNLPSQSSTIKDAKLAAMAALAAFEEDDEEEDIYKKSKKDKKKEDKKLAKMKKKDKKKGNQLDFRAEEDGDDNKVQGENANEEGELKQMQEKSNQEGGVKEQEVTLEQRIRASKPPAKIRIASDDLPAGQAFVRLQNIGVVFRNQQVLDDVTWQVQTGDRLGVVGPNGAGKSTQLKILAGELDPTTGEVIKSSKNLKLAFLRQEFTDELQEDRKLGEEFLSVFTEENKILQGLADVEKDLEKYVDEPDEMQKALERLSELQNEAERKKVYSLNTKVDKVLEMMGFVPEDANLPVSSFSGGWKMRIGLGKVLLQEPSVLLLDEPTNHLDLESVEWLEEFLSNQSENLPMAIVSHDREFLDKVCNRIVDTDLADATSYNGDYSNFIKQKKIRMEQWQASYDNQQKKIKEDKQFINRWKGDNTKQSAIGKKQQALDRLMASSDLIKRPPSNKVPFKFRFPAGPRVTGELGYVDKMSHKYGDNHLFQDASLRIEKGDRIAIVGPNGSGKSTLLRLLMGIEKPSIGGKAEISGFNVVTNYFQQSQADTLDMDKTVEDVITESSTTESYNELRALMAQFLFKGDTCKKKIAQLSGGEKARVALCKMMLTPANVLILDEPTNHLDIPAKEMLEEALQYYEGAIVIVSHDRYFISQVATKIVAVEDKKLVEYFGDYKYYMEKNAEIAKKVESRYVDGLQGIQNVKAIDFEALREKRNFGGKGGPSGNKTKGIKNAKRMNLDG